MTYLDLINKLKELGIKKPLEMSYQTDPKGFPGKGQFISESHNKIPFQITMYPPENQDFPTSMYESFEYHKLPRQNDKIGIGWIGGYIDPIKKIMYIAEIQSDLLQRTMEMIDPEKSKEVHKQELEQVKNKINNLMNFNPEERIKKLEDKINRTDPNHPAYQNMLNALNEMKENPQSQVNQQQLQKLQNRMKELESLINKPSGSKGIRNQREFHQYKSKVENYYKDWISIFFNTLLREGKRLRIQKVLIVSPQTLIKKWRQYAKPQTIKLFERIYQAMAEKQGAKLNNGWYELNISEAKFAMNWYKIYKKANFQIDFWRQHLDIYMKIYMKKMNEYYEEEDLNAEWRQSLEEEDSQENQLKKEAFEEWLKEVPNQLKLPNGELVPEFKREVRAYVNSEYGFDPFPYEDENHNLDDYIPSVEELEEQWSM